MGSRPDSITVVTVTRRRPRLLARAIASVRRQDYPGPVSHFIVVDDCPRTLASLRQLPSGEGIEWVYRRRRGARERPPERLARLRNEAVKLANSTWVAFLDDDNEYYCNHLSSLVTTAEAAGCTAVHSQRELFWRNGKRYLAPVFPWCRTEQEGARVYEELVKLRVFERGSHVMRDRVERTDHRSVVTLVDTSEWLIARSLALKYPFPTQCSASDWAARITEDDLLLRSLVAAGVSISCSGLATLRYYLGGYSNQYHRNPQSHENGDAA